MRNLLRFLRGTRCSLSIALTLAGTAVLPARAATCTHEQLAAAVDLAGEQLRQLTAATQPAVKAKLLRLKIAKGWSDNEYEEKGYAALADDRTAKLDASANELLARMDQLGGDDGAAAAPDCARIAEVEAVSLELQATVKAKSQYLLTRLDQMAADPGAVASVETPTAPVAPKSPATKGDSRWSTQTKSTPVPPPPAVATPPPQVLQQVPPPAAVATAPPVPEPEGYTIDEIVDASRGLFGKVSANLARVLEHAFAQSGRPAGYILGQETGGAFVAGLRYGQGTLYLRRGGSMPIYWHGPSLGADVGAHGASTLFLVYKIGDGSDVFSSFTGIEGSAFVVGGIGLTYMSNGRVDMAPIRSGIGLRVGANLGYIRFTGKPTWNPF